MIMALRFIGLKNLNDSEVLKTKTIAKRNLEKLERGYPNSLLKIHIKKADQTGNRCRYTILSNLEAPTVKLKSEAEDWELSRTIHKALQKLENEVKKV